MSVVDTSMKQLSLAQPDRRDTGFFDVIVAFLTDFQRTVFDTYQPERHYMRGPGPACAAKRTDRR